MHWWLNQGKEVKEEITKRREEIPVELQYEFKDEYWSTVIAQGGSFREIISQDRPETPKPKPKKETKKSRTRKKKVRVRRVTSKLFLVERQKSQLKDQQ